MTDFLLNAEARGKMLDVFLKTYRQRLADARAELKWLSDTGRAVRLQDRLRDAMVVERSIERNGILSKLLERWKGVRPAGKEAEGVNELVRLVAETNAVDRESLEQARWRMRDEVNAPMQGMLQGLDDIPGYIQKCAAQDLIDYADITLLRAGPEASVPVLTDAKIDKLVWYCEDAEYILAVDLATLERWKGSAVFAAKHDFEEAIRVNRKLFANIALIRDGVLASFRFTVDNELRRVAWSTR